MRALQKFIIVSDCFGHDFSLCYKPSLDALDGSCEVIDGANY